MSGYIIFPRDLIFTLYASSVLYINLIYTYLIHVTVERSVINFSNNDGNLNSKHIFLHKHRKNTTFSFPKKKHAKNPSHMSPTRVTDTKTITCLT